MNPFVLNGPEDYRLIPQRGVRQYRYPRRFSHNAIWDSTAGPDGKLYYGLATEIATSGYVRLCTYDYRTDTVEELFRVEDAILPQDRAIRASKFHSSLCFMPDGRLIMTTHTTDRSPRHPTWMPVAYYHHLWEGFAGGNILIYDPKTKKVENLGIPVPHESIYGAVYEPGHNALYFLGFLRGHLYRYGLDDRKVTDFGKVTETYSFRLVPGPDGNIYSASRTGHVYRINTDTLTLTDLMYQFRHEPFEYHTFYNNLSIARIGPDKRLYMAVMYGRDFVALDTKTGEFEDLGPYLPADRYSPDENRNCVFGMDFDSSGVLWYVVTSLNNYEANREFGIPASLFRWDVTRGGRPEWMGVAGTAERACGWNSEVVVTKDDILYITGSNHSLDGPELTGIDLRQFEADRPGAGGKLLDPYFDPEDPDYIQSAQEIHGQEEIMAANPTNAGLPVAGSPVLLWRALAPDHIEDSAVRGLFWRDSETLCGICGRETEFAFTIRGGALDWIRPLAELPEKEQAIFHASLQRVKGPEVPALPWYPGRQYKARLSADAALPDGRRVAGTEDGMLAIVEGEKVFALGPAAVNGPVHCLSAKPDGSAVYGVAGDEEDIAMLFRYDDRRGLRWLGHMGQVYGRTIDDVFYCTYVTSCAVSPDGALLAVGAEERLGTVVLYRV